MGSKRRHTAETKLRVVKEALETGNGSVVARRYNLSTSMVNRWIRDYRQYGEAAFNGNIKVSNSHHVDSKEYSYWRNTGNMNFLMRMQ